MKKFNLLLLGAMLCLVAPWPVRAEDRPTEEPTNTEEPAVFETTIPETDPTPDNTSAIPINAEVTETTENTEEPTAPETETLTEEITESKTTTVFDTPKELETATEPGSLPPTEGITASEPPSELSTEADLFETSASTSSTTMIAEPEIIPTVNVSLKIFALDQYLIQSDWEVSACPIIPGATTTALTAWCALDQISQASGWKMEHSIFGEALFISRINDFNGSDGNWWAFFFNQEFSNLALNQTLLNPNDQILLTYGAFPLRITPSDPAPLLDTTTTIQIEEFGFSPLTWEPTWLTSSSTTMVTNNVPMGTVSGEVQIRINTTSTQEITFSKTGFIPASILLSPILPTSTSASNTETKENNNEGQTPIPNEEPNPLPPPPNLISVNELYNTANRILTFLSSQQDATGKINEAGISDWSAMSFGAKQIYASTIKQNSQSLTDYLTDYKFDSATDLNLCAAYPRHLLAFQAAGVPSNHPAFVSTTVKMQGCFKADSYGEAGINDDVFALLATLSLDSTNEDQISLLEQTILQDQQIDGSFTWNGWPGPDITGAALAALKYAKDKGRVIDHTHLERAKQYLKTSQLTEGGWGMNTADALSTSWAMMGLIALGENQEDWVTTNNHNPWEYLDNQVTDYGYIISPWTNDIDWFATKHAVPALLSQPWPILMNEDRALTTFIDKQISSSLSLEPVASTSPIIVVTTSTPEIILETVSTTPSTTTTVMKSEILEMTEEEMPAKLLPGPPLPPQKQLSDIVNAEKQPLKNNQIMNSISFSAISNQSDSLPTILNAASSTLPQTSPRALATNVFEGAVTVATGLGAYLVWRLISSLV
ncbi:MAG TPA: DUF4430 domain-containing protein [Patescibacteria group bacterium]|nr:DUF4430 domain-containing protein [Patescibacteria group bacterium]